jgi:hypothetical protein
MNAVWIKFFAFGITSEEDPILSVSGNGLPVGSIKLNSVNANSGGATFQIPLNFFMPAIMIFHLNPICIY